MSVLPKKTETATDPRASAKINAPLGLWRAPELKN